jgi:hypothetical protein
MLGGVVFAGGWTAVVVVSAVVVAVVVVPVVEVVVVAIVDADPIATELASPAPMANASAKALRSRARMRGLAWMRVRCMYDPPFRK